MNKKWYSTAYRRNLVDMHIEDWDDRFLSTFDPEDYYENLKLGHIQAPMIYLQSHVGYCNFPTKTARIHRAFEKRPDTMKRLIDRCRNGGMFVVGYYSLIYNRHIADQHPDWRMENENGPIDHGRHGLLCPNNPEYRAFTLAQIAEMAEYCQVDGMFYDMLFWPHVCRCAHCRKRFAEEVGGEIPAEDWYEERWIAFVNQRALWMGEFAKLATDATKRLMGEHVTVEHNYANAISDNWKGGSTEAVNEACDYTGGDLYGDLFDHSFTAKYYKNVTKNQPFEYMTCRCDRFLTNHTVMKSQQKLRVEILLTAAHHGASLIIDAVDPCGSLDPRVYNRIGKVFTEQEQYEPYFRGEMTEDVGVYFSTSSKFNRDGQKFDNKSAANGAIRTLISAHIPCGVASNGSIGALSKHRLVILPAINNLSSTVREQLISYVKNGGHLYFSGDGAPELFREFFGGSFTGITPHQVTYLAPVTEGGLGEFTDLYPLAVDFRLPMAELPNQKGVFATIKLPYTIPNDGRYASIHSNPPGIATDMPGVVLGEYGEGRVMWSAAPIEQDQRHAIQQAFLGLIKQLDKDRPNSFYAKAPAHVELTMFQNGTETLINLVDLTALEPGFPISGFPIRVKTAQCPNAVVRVKDQRAIKFTYEDGYTCFTAAELDTFDLYQIQ